MGEIADMMIDGTLDEQTGEYIGKAVGYPRTMQKGFYNSVIKNETAEQKQVRAIRKEIALDIKSGTAVQEARRKANIKYGKGWRIN